MTRRPNILFFMTGRHRADWPGCAGYPVVKALDIDGLTKHGTRFTDFCVTSSVCMPNRGTIVTDRCPSVNSLRHNGLPLPTVIRIFVDPLRAAGHSTISIGKSRLQPFTDCPLLHSDETKQVSPDVPETPRLDNSDYEHEHPSRYEIAEPHRFLQPYYGFYHVHMETGHSDECGGHHLRWLWKKTDDWVGIRDWANRLPHDYTCPQTYLTSVPEKPYPTAYIREDAKSCLSECAIEDVPFFAFVLFPDPYHPFTPPGEYRDMYDPDDFGVELPYEAHDNSPPQTAGLERLLDARITPKNGRQSLMAPEPRTKEGKAFTKGMITMVDDTIGDIPNILEKTGRADNTIIILHAGHGDRMDALSALLKGSYPHHSVNRVPFFLVDPKRGIVAETEGLAVSIDIAATILERCDVLSRLGMQGGRFILGQLPDEPATRDAVLIKRGENKVCPGFDNPVVGTHRLMIYKGLEFGEFHDLQSDPDETHNLRDNAASAENKVGMMFQPNQAMLDAIEPGPWPQRFA